MSIIKKRMLFAGYDERAAYFSVLFDSGASHSFISKAVADEMHAPLLPPDFETAETATAGYQMRVLGSTTLKFIMSGEVLNDAFYVAHDLTEDVIIGAGTLQKYRIKLDFEHDEVFVAPRAGKVQLI